MVSKTPLFTRWERIKRNQSTVFNWTAEENQRLLQAYNKADGTTPAQRVRLLEARTWRFVLKA